MTIRKYTITSPAIDSSGDAVAYSIPIRGKILEVSINYPAATCTVDLDSDGELKAQKILDLAAANTDVALYPRTPVHTYTGAETVLWFTALKVHEPFVVYGRIKLTVASGTVTQVVVVDIIVDED